MNQYAKEIHEELTRLCEKYQITKGILLCEEIDIKDTTKKNYRSIIFKPNTDKFDVEEFSILVQNILSVSKTFRSIIDYMNNSYITEFIQSIRKPKRGD